MTSTQRFFALFALLTVSTSAEAQSPDSISIVRGTVRGSHGAAVVGADVFLLETLDGATTDSLGRFAIRTAHRDSATIVARRIGFAPAQLRMIVADLKPILIVLERQAPALTPITVTAGAYTAGSERGASLNAIQVASTPGA
ncbi:MAG TPA: carboxypeptidase regulatory-like domain-containing protein, partial [Gemmatimonadaceae bacterium]|nr:carboxypeptidase regulatory-like domain-containing protein [Gemmatimonadaceae bacterium]